MYCTVDLEAPPTGLQPPEWCSLPFEASWCCLEELAKIWASKTTPKEKQISIQKKANAATVNHPSLQNGVDSRAYQIQDPEDPEVVCIEAIRGRNSVRHRPAPEWRQNVLIVLERNDNSLYRMNFAESVQFQTCCRQQRFSPSATSCCWTAEKRNPKDQWKDLLRLSWQLHAACKTRIYWIPNLCRWFSSQTPQCHPAGQNRPRYTPGTCLRQLRAVPHNQLLNVKREENLHRWANFGSARVSMELDQDNRSA